RRDQAVDEDGLALFGHRRTRVQSVSRARDESDRCRGHRVRPTGDALRDGTPLAGGTGLCHRATGAGPHRPVVSDAGEFRQTADIAPAGTTQADGDGAACGCGTYLRSAGRRSARRGGGRDRRGVLREEHGCRNRRVGRRRGSAAPRRSGLFRRVRNRAPLPRCPDPGYRWRYQRDTHEPGSEKIGVHIMTVLRSRLDTSSAEYSTNRAAMLDKLEELETEHSKAVAGGGEKYVRKHKDRGKLLARERIELLLDEDSPFLELSPLAAWGADYHVGGSTVTGIGVREGVESMLIASDSTIKGGAMNPWGLKKGFRAADIAAKNRLPTINLVESGGADLPAQKDIFIPGGRTFRDLTQSSARGIPTIALVFGNSTAGGAYLPGMSDYVVMVDQQAKVFLGGPPLVWMATGEDADDESLGGADMH